ncbi:MAG: wax ester/triacylglycerol synthase family O-acyltransferase, partial [Ramlibacter sp.]
MKSLSGLDATFLYLETPETPMHVGSLNLYELPPGFKGSFHKAVRQHIGKRMHLAPIFSRRLAFMPFDLGHPIWVEAEEVDLDFHVRKVPGKRLTVRQAEAMAAKLHGQLIDREHPLWEFYVFDDIKAPAAMGIQGKLVGFYSKIHHAALDGKGGTVLANAVLDLSATPRDVAPADGSRKGRTAADLKIGEMIGAVFSNSLAQYAKLARSLPSAATSLGGTVARQSFSGGDKGLTSIRPKSPISLAPKTIFNVGITRERVFATATIPFAESKAMAKAVGGSFNDIILWICSTALRNYLTRHATLPKKPLVAAMPVSLREESNKELNNQASITVVDLGTHLADPLKRLNAIMGSTAKVKEALVNLKSVLPTDYPSLLSPWVMGGAARALFKTYGKSGIADKLPAVANVAISNVPGPQVPLYLAGARMVTFHPLSIVMHGLALNITIQTYAGRVDFGIVADKKAVPHMHDLADALEAAFEEAKQL